MDNLFITASGKLQARWLEAFPSAAVVNTVAAARSANIDIGGVIWLDAGSIEVAKRDALVTNTLSLRRPIVFLSATPSESEAFHVLNLGAVGYAHSFAAPNQLKQIRQVVINGGVWMVPELMKRLVTLTTRVAIRKAPEEDPLQELTSREVMVAKQVGKGASNKEIAGTLHITERTVKAHLSTIFEKLEVRDRVQLALTVNHVVQPETVS